MSKLLKMQQLEDEDELAYVTEQAVKDGGPDSSVGLPTSDGRPAWMRTLHNSATTWLQLLPQSLQTLKRTVENIKDPLYRYFEREVNFGSKLLQEVIHDLNEVVAICQVCNNVYQYFFDHLITFIVCQQGEKKQTNYHRSLLSDLVKGKLPAGWRRYTVPSGCTVIQWVSDFSQRVKQLQQVSQLVSQRGANQIKVSY